MTKQVYSASRPLVDFFMDFSQEDYRHVGDAVWKRVDKMTEDELEHHSGQSEFVSTVGSCIVWSLLGSDLVTEMCDGGPEFCVTIETDDDELAARLVPVFQALVDHFDAGLPVRSKVDPEKSGMSADFLPPDSVREAWEKAKVEP